LKHSPMFTEEPIIDVDIAINKTIPIWTHSYLPLSILQIFLYSFQSHVSIQAKKKQYVANHHLFVEKCKKNVLYQKQPMHSTFAANVSNISWTPI
jgi:hypothetical protein